MITDNSLADTNSWAETKAHIDQVVNQARAERAKFLRAAAVQATASMKRFFAGFRSPASRNSAAV